MQVVNHMKKEFLSAVREKNITVWLKLDLIVTNLKFTD